MDKKLFMISDNLIVFIQRYLVYLITKFWIYFLFLLKTKKYNKNVIQINKNLLIIDKIYIKI
ncbi:hypothetical protein AF332_05470 [Sporosarcina globispora]|uniref:Uncharacterized protein n=1 Tax=Sporosarcina globispora TaxID=1459 RepID=A0A0M0GA59_SPOGL|nr:hypothetical protein AF332_05470 [Sporosarcina globispora]